MQHVVYLDMDMKLGIIRGDLSKTFIARENEIYADSKDKEKKKKHTKILKKKSRKSSCKDLFEDFHSVDLIG